MFTCIIYFNAIPYFLMRIWVIVQVLLFQPEGFLSAFFNL
jgi:hypothetical protein